MHEEHASPDFLTRSRVVAVAASLCVAAGFGATEKTTTLGPATTVGAFVALVATGTLLFVVLDAVRASFRIGGGSNRHVVVSGLEALVVFGFGFVAEPFASLDGPRALIATAVFTGLVLVHALLARRMRRLALAVVAAALVASCAAHRLANPGLYGWFHAASCAIATMSVARLADLLGPSHRLTTRQVALVVVVAAALAEASVTMPSVRARAVWQSPTTAAFAKPLVLLSDVDRDGAGSVLGSVDCAPFDAGRGPFVIDRPGDRIDQDCDGMDAPVARADASTRARTPDPNPDVLVLSVDAFRADASGRLVRTRAALGQPFEFTLAVAPSVRTMNSFAAMLRGRTLDELPFGRDSLRSTLLRNDMPTIGSAMRRRGYRSAFVATHSYLAPRTGIVVGFDFLRRESMPYDDPAHRELEAMLDADVAIDLVLDAARESQAPLFVWAHLMETHAPYRESHERLFGTDRADYDRALDLQDGRIADAIERFRAIRGRPVLVVILGDHGESFGEHGFSFHSSNVHAEQARVPFLLGIPGTIGRRVDSPVSTAALAATLLEWTTGTTEPGFTVPSLGGCMTGETPCPRVAITELFSLGRPGDASIRAYTTRHERWIVDRAHDVAQRFDLDRDPGELRPRTSSARDVARRLSLPTTGR